MKRLNAVQINRNRCRLAIIVCILICFLVFLGVCMQLIENPEAESKEVGWKTYHLFTILSNMLMAVAAAMCIPYAVDGLRRNNYHLPRWYVNLMYTGTTGVAVTLIVAVTVLSPAAGFYYVMLWDNNLFLHTICPILSIFLFFHINSDHRIGFRRSFFAMIPVLAYAVVYLIMVFVIGEDAGGWRDHYQVGTVAAYLPLPVIMLILCVLCFTIANVLRLIHNRVHKRRKAVAEEYYQEAYDSDCPDIQSAIKALARDFRNRDADKRGDLVVPRRIMLMMEKKYNSGLSVGEMCSIYISEFYKEN